MISKHTRKVFSVKKALIGYQVYSAREEASKDLAGVLKQLKDMGYDAVEFAGYYGHTSREVKAMLDDTGLIALSAHEAIRPTVAGIMETIAFGQEIGLSYMAIPFTNEADRPGGPNFARTIQNIYQYGRLCKEAGIQLLYHNHDFEFTTISGEYGLDFLYDAVPADLLKTELDTCWVKYAGEDPAAYIRKYAGRAPVVHLKDFVGRKDGRQPYALISEDGSGKDDGAADAAVSFEFRPVGYGCQDVPSLIEAGLESGAKAFVVEQDLSIGRPALEAARMSREYLLSIGI